MSANGWLQLSSSPRFCWRASVRWPLPGPRAGGERTWLTPVLRPIERLIYRLSGINSSQEMNWRDYAFAVLGFSAVSLLSPTALSGCNPCCREPAGTRQRRTDLAWNTAASFHYQHQLAVVHARDDDELSDADGRSGVSQLPLGGGGHLGGCGADPWHQANQFRAPSATSGWTPRVPCFTCCCPPR